jgi:predicted CopG family antitoxin
MSRTLTIADELYERLETEARARGLESIEQMLEEIGRSVPDFCERKEVVSKIDKLRERLFAQHGEMPDSVELLSEDRAR